MSYFILLVFLKVATPAPKLFCYQTLGILILIIQKISLVQTLTPLTVQKYDISSPPSTANDSLSTPNNCHYCSFRRHLFHNTCLCRLFPVHYFRKTGK